MPLTFGMPLGIAILLIGLVLFFATNKKKVAKVTIGIGAALTLLTLVLVILAISSPM